MKKKRELTDEERLVWKALTKDIKPLSKEPKIAAKELPPAPIRKSRIQRIESKPEIAMPPASGQADSATVTRVKRGEYAIEAKIDLHGYTLEQAYEKLGLFVETNYRKGRRSLLVITGKSGQLAREVPRWLSHSGLSRMILVVSSAPDKHGGKGAYTLLLRRKKP